MSRRYLPEPFNTPTEAHYAETTQRLYDNEREDQHRDAMDDTPASRVEACVCDSRSCLVCAWRRVAGGAA